MPVQYRIDKALKIVFNTGVGSLTEEDLLGHQNGLRVDPNFDARFWQLYDFRDAEVSEIPPTCIETLAQSTIFRSDTRGAVVVRSNLAYGLARMFQALQNGSRKNVRVFRDMAAALAWLELD